jgi:type VI secretion system protein ImpF
MSKAPNNARFVPPIMQAFRASFEARDSGKEIDERTENDERMVAGRRTSPRNAVSATVLRNELTQDLQSLLNTVNLAAAEDLEALPEVSQSILNFGVDDLAGIAFDSQSAIALDSRMRDVLINFEPRLIRDTIMISRNKNRDGSDARLAFHVTAEMHAAPHDIAVEFVADVETYSGQVLVKDA